MAERLDIENPAAELQVQRAAGEILEQMIDLMPQPLQAVPALRLTWALAGSLIASNRHFLHSADHGSSLHSDSPKMDRNDSATVLTD
jgi:hypothetical protein